MKISMVILISLVVMQGFYSPALAQGNPSLMKSTECLEQIWVRTKPTEEEKKFDLDNDVNLHNRSFSCFSSISATEIHKVLSEVKKAVATNDKARLAKIAVYPFGYWVKTEKPTEYGYYSPKEAQNEQEFIKRYDEIVVPEFQKIIKCASLKKLLAHRDGVISLATSYIFFSKEPDNNKDIVRDFLNYPLRLSSISLFVKRHENWIEKNCK